MRRRGAPRGEVRKGVEAHRVEAPQAGQRGHYGRQPGGGLCGVQLRRDDDAAGGGANDAAIGRKGPAQVLQIDTETVVPFQMKLVACGKLHVLQIHHQAHPRVLRIITFFPIVKKVIIRSTRG